MNNKQFDIRGFLALLLFLCLAAGVLFAPAGLIGLDTSIQTVVRGDLPALATAFFSNITLLFNTSIVVGWVLVLVVFLVAKKKKHSALFLAGNLATSGLVIVVLKNIFQRPRPAIQHLVEEHGFSFPSGHSLAATLVCGSLIILAGLAVKNVTARRTIQFLLGLLVVIILISRVYVGVHYPSDVLAGLFLGLGILHLEYPKLRTWLKKDY